MTFWRRMFVHADTSLLSAFGPHPHMFAIRFHGIAVGFVTTALLFLFSVTPAPAAWRTEEIRLRPGWNAVYLETQPEPDDVESVFAGLPITSVWMWNQEDSPVQFVQDPSQLIPERSDWLSYFPFDGDAFKSLYAVRAGRSYLIRVHGEDEVTWAFTGKVAVRPSRWRSDSFNLTGFPVDPSGLPTFQSVLAGSPAHSPLRAYRLDAAGQWQPISGPTTEQVHSNEAYWIYSVGASEYPGPIEIVAEQGGEINFGRILTEQILRVRNHTADTRRVSLAVASSDSPPQTPGTQVGAVPLSYWDAVTSQWRSLTSLQQDVAAHGELALKVAVRRPEMEQGRDLYDTILLVADGRGTRISVPVVAKPIGSAAAGTALQAGGPPDARSGLWVGSASINRVSHAAAASNTDRDDPVPTASEFTIRLIVHVDASGQARLLQHITLMWKDGTRKPDPENPSVSIVGEPGRLVLVSNDDLLANFQGAALRDGTPVGKRISSSAFPFTDPLPLTGQFDGALHLTNLRLDYNDPLNPFVHRYHPNHDNLDARFEKQLKAGEESFTIIRNIDLSFSAVDPDGLNRSGWGDTQVGGDYRERILGLHREELFVSGTFRLHRVSHVPVLNDGL